MRDFKQYLQHELNKLSEGDTLKVQIRDNAGAFTNWVTLPGISTVELLQMLTKGKE